MLMSNISTSRIKYIKFTFEKEKKEKKNIVEYFYYFNVSIN